MDTPADPDNTRDAGEQPSQPQPRQAAPNPQQRRPEAPNNAPQQPVEPARRERRAAHSATQPPRQQATPKTPNAQPQQAAPKKKPEQPAPHQHPEPAAPNNDGGAPQSPGPEPQAEFDPLEGILDDSTPEPEVELIKEPGKKKAPKKRRADGDKPHHLDPNELLSRLADRNNVIMELTRKNQRLEKECKVLQDKALRSAAEFDNFRKRSRKEWDLLKQQAKADVILEVLNVVDDFERAFSVVGDRDDDFVQGIRLIHNNLVTTLEKIGVQRIEALHALFDPNFHMAVAQVDSKDVESGYVVEVAQQGYLLDDVVIRPARVVIAK